MFWNATTKMLYQLFALKKILKTDRSVTKSDFIYTEQASLDSNIEMIISALIKLK